MKRQPFPIRTLLLIPVFVLATGTLYAQSAGSPVPDMDSAVKVLAGELNRKLIEERVQSISMGQFTHRETVPPLSSYWTNQLSDELTKISGRSYTILSGGTAGADWIITGEIVEVADTIRIHTRLIRSADRAIAAAFQSDFQRNEQIVEMLYSGNGRSSYVPRDAWEPDSFDNPVTAEIGIDENAPVMNRTIHSGNDEDFFLLIPGRDGRLTMETTGDLDTYMEFYNADTREQLRENDDGGSGLNARIRYNVQAGRRYIAKVRGYGDDAGSYGFHAYIQDTVIIAPDEYEPDDDYTSAKWIYIGTPQQHSFHHGDDEDWVKFQVTQRGRYTIRARGINSNRLDTYIELFDANLKDIDDDDDGGENYDALLSLTLDPGLYYLKVWCYDDDPEEPYTIRIDLE